MRRGTLPDLPSSLLMGQVTSLLERKRELGRCSLERRWALRAFTVERMERDCWDRLGGDGGEEGKDIDREVLRGE